MKVFLQKNESSAAALASLLTDRSIEETEVELEDDILSSLNSENSSLGVIEENYNTREWLLTGKYKIFAEIFLEPKSNLLNKASTTLKRTAHKNNEEPSKLRRYLLIGRAFFDLPNVKSNKVTVILNYGDNEFKKIKDSVDKAKLEVVGHAISHEDERVCLLDLRFKGLLDLSSLESVANDIRILGIYESGKKIGI